MFQKFWAWYERHYTLNVGIAAGLFIWQLVHLYWLSAHVVSLRLWGVSYWPLEPLWQYLLILVDYTEIPALIVSSFVYIQALRLGFNWKSVLMLFLANSQWLHLFWITDEFIIASFRGVTTLPVRLAWIAIFIDYLELPVIFDIMKKFLLALRARRLKEFLATDLR